MGFVSYSLILLISGQTFEVTVACEKFWEPNGARLDVIAWPCYRSKRTHARIHQLQPPNVLDPPSAVRHRQSNQQWQCWKSDFNLRQNRNNNANAIQTELKIDRVNRAETYSYHPSPQCTPKEKSWWPRILIGETSSCSYVWAVRCGGCSYVCMCAFWTSSKILIGERAAHSELTVFAIKAYISNKIENW